MGARQSETLRRKGRRRVLSSRISNTKLTAGTGRGNGLAEGHEKTKRRETGRGKGTKGSGGTSERGRNSTEKTGRERTGSGQWACKRVWIRGLNNTDEGARKHKWEGWRLPTTGPETVKR